MPELPEVETIARTLEPQIRGRTIVSVRLLNPGSLHGALPLEALLGRSIASTGRRGKLLLWQLEPDVAAAVSAPVSRPDSLALHLKMTGRVFVHPPEQPPGPHTRALFDLDDGQRVFFDDARKFGYVRVLTPQERAGWPFWQGLGPEPLEIDAATFAACFATRRGRLKALLLDQSLVAGVGNIYADESLFRAGLRPDRPVQSCSPADLCTLHAALVEVLEESIAACGSSIRDYRTARGDAGAFQNAFRVYGRAGHPCTQCGRTLEGTRLAGRATVFCPFCQKGGQQG